VEQLMFEIEDLHATKRMLAAYAAGFSAFIG
jgi:hypothetical protein